MDSLDPASPAAATIDVASQPTSRVWKFWGTAFWGFVVFAAMFVGQLAVVGWFLFRQGGAINQESFSEAVRIVVSNGLTISLSVITGLPAVLLALWIAIRIKGARFADYLALRSFSWINLASAWSRCSCWSWGGTRFRGRRDVTSSRDSWATC